MEKYFGNLTSDDIGQSLIEKCEDYYKFLNSSGTLSLWKDSYKTFYNGYFGKGQVCVTGKQGEKREFIINHFQSLLSHIKVLTTDQRPVFEPKSVNSDYKSTVQVVFARSLLDYYMHHKKFEDAIDSVMDYALQSGEGYLFLEFNSSIGKIIGKKKKKNAEEDIEKELYDVKREGDIEVYSLHPVDIVRDIYKDTSDNNEWYIVRRRVNKYNLAARYPDYEEEIVGSSLESNSNLFSTINDYDFKTFSDSEQIYFFTFRHIKNASLPEGRQVEFLADGTVIFDGDLPYNDISIYSLMPMKRRNSNFGYTVAFDLLAMQKVDSLLNSTVVTNQNAFGVQNITAPKGSGIIATSLTGGLNLIEYSGDSKMKPEPLNLLATPPEIFNYEANIVQQMETVSGVNSVARGNPEASLRSGSSLALVQSMSIQYNSGLQHSYSQLLENFGTGIINMLKEYANSPRVALIAGLSKKPYLKEFNNKDIEKIDRVVVDMGNPMSKTLAGRLQIADNLVERGLIDSPEQYLQIQQTGRLDPLIEGKMAEILNIRSENEKMAAGDRVFALYTDNHALHIKEHKNVLSSPDARNEREIIMIVDDHIKEHLGLLQTTDPGILFLLGQQPIPSNANSVNGVQPVPPIPNQPDELTPVQGQAGTPPSGGAEAAPSGMGTSGIGMVNMPSQPSNPLTGEKFNTETGGL